ncbi:hypothetical protein ACFQ3R_01015 [Mesonia ostreae]|uniref:4'-phosphopantetheinyl transferase domain-containing protein n=1 Tax=Mesonia ostreae TaxID=861110 RepID=A0ABU2KHR4_9FLAO|nr:hypothetical protein [Mesonia ostreae]MDT0294262.1 hypothetical protein [Mesonia ostreae]
MECSVLGIAAKNIKGIVSLGAAQFYTFSTFSDNCIYTWCTSEKHKQVIHRKIVCKHVKEALLKSISEKEQIPWKDLSIVKDQNQIPQLYLLKKPLGISFSISHHGDKAAFAF